MTTNIKAIIFACALVLGAFLFSLAIAPSAPTVEGAEFPQQSVRVSAYASSTTFSLTAGTAQRIAATSTRLAATDLAPVTRGRTAVTVQAINCGVGGSVWLKFADVVPAVSTGIYLNASSTITFGDEMPMGYGSIQALATTANCGLLVTEFRSEY